MRENKKGFTLIELLAVIVILAIIALIATPVIMKIIDDSRKSAAEQSAKLIVQSFTSAYYQASLAAQSKTDVNDVNVLPTLSDTILAVEADGISKDNSANTISDGFGVLCQMDYKEKITDENDQEIDNPNYKHFVCSGGRLEKDISTTSKFEFAEEEQTH